jgi:hypothetical protein
MNENLTSDERKMLARIVAADKWDNLTYDLSILLPAFSIIGFGIYLDSTAAILTGMMLYATFAIRASIGQARSFPILKSLLEKLSKTE